MKLIDLTLELKDGMQTFPGHPALSIKVQSSFENSKERYLPPCNGFESRFISFSDHSGTHVDAPLHFIANGQSVTDMDIYKLMGTALLLDVSELKRPEEAVTKDILEEAERKQGVYVEKEDIVLIKTWKKGWGEAGFFEAKALSACAGEWLSNKQVNVVGIDLPNIDVNENMRRDVHMNLLSKNIYIVENLVNLELVPRTSRFIFIGIPLKLSNATASPIRALAMLDAQII